VVDKTVCQCRCSKAQAIRYAELHADMARLKLSQCCKRVCERNAFLFDAPMSFPGTVS
jgi:hypothetical protein